ncbi:MAG: hypothetical protein ETSY2_09640, partial [Candidatus Entotheonella gemina]
MAFPQTLLFGPYHLDCQSGTLWCDEQQIAMRPQTFALLRYLAERSGDIVTVSELQQHAWQDEHVTPSVFRVSIHELRQALHDDASHPQYIETVRGQGYRFCAPVTVPGGNQFRNTLAIIGRDPEHRQLQDRLALAQHGQRQLVFVSGQAGMGKTTLVEAFLSALTKDPTLSIGRGYCIEHHGPAEAYLPVLQALGDLGQSPFRDPLVQALQRAAPTWLRQLPILMLSTEYEPLDLDVPAATRVRMIRELVDALGLLSQQQLVVLVLEDLHWSDPSTIDLLNAIMRRVEPARLFMLCTYRPLEVQVQDHPLNNLLQEYEGHGQQLDVRLTPWAPDAINTFLGQRLSGTVAQDLTAMLHERSDGNPLFLSRLLDYLMQQELLIDIHGQWHLRDEQAAYHALPQGVRQLLNKQIDQLPEMVQEVLKMASVAGMQFATAMVAAGAESEAGLIDEALSWAASRSYFLQAQAVETWPDGTISGTYRFGHALYREIFYERLSAERRVKLHRLMGERLERAFIDDSDAVSGLLAYHFAQGMEVSRALHYLHQASVRALHRFAANEAIALLNTALGLLPDLPPEQDRVAAEYYIQATLGTAIISARGARVPEAGTAYQRAYRLGKTIGDIDQFFPTVVGLENMAFANADYIQSQHLGGELLNYAQITRSPLHLAYAYCALCINQAMQGHLLAAHEYAEACRRIPVSPAPYGILHPMDPFLMCQRWDVVVLTEMGYPEQAAALSRACMERAVELGDPFNMMQALVSVMMLHTHFHPPEKLYEAAQAVLIYGQQQGQPFWEATGQIFSAGAMARLGQAVDGLA